MKNLKEQYAHIVKEKETKLAVFEKEAESYGVSKKETLKNAR